ncbi:MAG: tetratricopeptide repeat protein [Verrucomicrobia bacterium]|nr:tetratricopeptide repeat protein [Verrucomicrobiota bacterium]
MPPTVDKGRFPSSGRRWAAALLLAALAGCATAGKTPSYPLTGDPLVDGPRAIAEGPERDRVLWECRMAAAALRRGRWDVAKSSLDDALARISHIYGPDKSARKARSLFHKEARKTFVGEPYERVMAWYYRGILYWRDGEPDNARACFRSAQLMDADAETHAYAADYVLLDYLDGLATMKLGGDGMDMIRRAKKHARLAIPPDPDPRANVLCFIEYGKGPVKYAAGDYKEQLRFKPGYSKAKEVMVRVDGKAAHVGPYDDLYFQATTRGGRVMDYVLGRKAVFKSTADTVGDAALITGAALAVNRKTDEAGLALLAAGAVSKILAAAAQPQADTRMWDNLPLYLTFAAFRLPPGAYQASFEFLDADRKPFPELTKIVKFRVPADGRDTVLFVSDQSLSPQEQ